jgi:hypothetical protein
MNKKRPRKDKHKKKDNSDTDNQNKINQMEEDDDINGDSNQNELFNCVFIFSCILPEYFLMIKNIILPNFILENVSLNGLTDLIICMREDIGTTLKVENDDENKIFGVFTLIPFPFYKTNPVVSQLLNMFKSKIQNIEDNNSKITLINILSNKRLGLLINERFLNLPEPLIAPSLNFIINEMNECIDIANDKNNKNISKEERNKYNLDYIIIYSRYVIKDKNFNEDNEKCKYDDSNNINLVIKGNLNKKQKVDLKDEKIYYKYETECFLQKADYNFDYKLTGGIYDSASIYIDQNNHENQYMKVILITINKFLEVIQELNKKS